MSRITAIIASIALVSSVTVAAAGPAVVPEGDQLVLSTQSAPGAVGSLGGLGTGVIVGGVLITTVLIGAIVNSNNSSGSH